MRTKLGGHTPALGRYQPQPSVLAERERALIEAAMSAGTSGGGGGGAAANLLGMPVNRSGGGGTTSTQEQQKQVSLSLRWLAGVLVVEVAQHVTGLTDSILSRKSQAHWCCSSCRFFCILHCTVRPCNNRWRQRKAQACFTLGPSMPPTMWTPRQLAATRCKRHGQLPQRLVLRRRQHTGPRTPRRSQSSTTSVKQALSWMHSSTCTRCRLTGTAARRTTLAACPWCSGRHSSRSRRVAPRPLAKRSRSTCQRRRSTH